MLVRAGPDGIRRADDPSGSRAWITELFEGAHGIPGILLLGPQVPHQLHGHRAVDAVSITPSGITAIEFSELLQRQRGTLHCALSAGWTVNGQPALLQTKQANPVQELETNVYALGEALGRHGVSAGQIRGLVVVIPVEPGDVTLSGHGGFGRSVQVVLAEQLRSARDLGRHLQHQGRRKQAWSADGALAVCEALGMAEQTPSPRELINEGFAAHAAGRTPSRSTSTLRMPPLRTPKPAVAPTDPTVADPPVADPPVPEPTAAEPATAEPTAVTPTAVAPSADPPVRPTVAGPAPSGQPQQGAENEPPTPPQGVPALPEQHEPETARQTPLRRTLPSIIALLIIVVLGLVLVQWVHQLFHP